MEQEKSCGCIILDSDKVLLVKHNEGHWDFPKGHMEEGETEVQTAIREVKEETNLDVMIKDEKDKYIIEYVPRENVLKKVVFFVAKRISGELKRQEKEISEIKWFELYEAVERITYLESKNIMKRIIEKGDVNA